MNKDNQYIFLTISNTILAAIVTILNMVVLSATSLGILTLYTLYLSYGYIFTLGIQDGIKLRVKVKDISFYKTNFKIVTIFIGQIFIALLMVSLLEGEYLIFVALSIPLQNMVGVFRQIFLGFSHLRSFIAIEIILKIFQIVGIIFVFVFNLDIEFLLLINFFARLIQLFICFGIYFMVYKRSKFISRFSFSSSITELFMDIKVGIIVTLAAWIFVFCFNFDTFFLRNNVELLGVYSQSKNFALILVSFIVPFSSMFFSKYDTSSSTSKIDFNIIKMLVLVFQCVFTYLLLYCFYHYFLGGSSIIFNETTLLIFTIIPFLLLMNVQLCNILLLTSIRKYIASSFGTLFIFIVSFVFTNKFFDGINIILLGNIFAFSLSFIFMTVIVLRKKSLKYIAIVIVYLLMVSVSIKDPRLVLIPFVVNIYFIYIIFFTSNIFRPNNKTNLYNNEKELNL